MKQLEGIKQLLDMLSKIESEKQNEILSCIELSSKVDKLIETSKNKPNYELNILDIINVAEPLTSLIISLIFKYKFKGKNILCDSFVTHFLSQCGFKLEWIKSPKITAETDRIDICVKERGKYAVIIENKLKGAAFQRNQLARYVQKMRNAGFPDEKIFIIVLPNYINRNLFDNINKSVWYLPPDWYESNQQRLCAHNDAVSCKCDYNESCENCSKCEKDLRQKFKDRTLILDVDFIEWFEGVCLPLIPAEEIVLKSAVQQFIDFLKGIFNKRLNDKLIMEIEELLRKELLDSNTSNPEQWKLLEQKKKGIDNLKAGLLNLQKSIAKEMIDVWYENLSVKWGKWLRHIEHESFGINIQGVWCGCWCDEDEEIQPWWGFQCDSPTSKQCKMVEKILESVGLNGDQNNWYISWGHTLHGDERCEQFYEAAVKLGYLK